MLFNGTGGEPGSGRRRRRSRKTCGSSPAAGTRPALRHFGGFRRTCFASTCTPAGSALKGIPRWVQQCPPVFGSQPGDRIRYPRNWSYVLGDPVPFGYYKRPEATANFIPPHRRRSCRIAWTDSSTRPHQRIPEAPRFRRLPPETPHSPAHPPDSRVPQQRTQVYLFVGLTSTR